MDGYVLLARHSRAREQSHGSRRARGQPLAMGCVGGHSQIPCGVTESTYSQILCFNIRLADAVGELPYFPEKNMHPKIIYSP